MLVAEHVEACCGCCVLNHKMVAPMCCAEDKIAISTPGENWQEDRRHVCLGYVTCTVARTGGPKGKP